MWRRLCVDVDGDGTVVGGSVEIYTDETARADCVLVMEPGWADGLSPDRALELLLRDGWLQPPLPMRFVPPETF